RRQLLTGGIDFHRLHGDGGGPDLRLCRVLRAVSAVVIPLAGVYPRRLLNGGVESGAEPPDSDFYSGTDGDLSALHRAGSVELHPWLVAQFHPRYRAGDFYMLAVKVD